jgi:uncharacterized protein (TIGR02266 family)
VSDGGLACDPATTLGAGGLFIETESPLIEGTHLKMRFTLPGSGIAHEIEGRVVWSRRSSDRGSYAPGMGIEFTDRASTIPLAQELETLD